MSPRTGRPTTDPKTHDTRIRMSDEDVRLLEICCQKTGALEQWSHPVGHAPLVEAE